MQKLMVFNHVTVDNFFESLEHDMAWAKHDSHTNEFAKKQLGKAGTILFGRVTYEMMASYWPTPQASLDNPEIAGFMNAAEKYVFSNTLNVAAWQNTRLVHGDAVKEVASLKEQEGNDMIIFGSGKLVSALTRAGLIDEYQFMVNPVILGRGTPMFNGLDQPVPLELAHTQPQPNGNILLVYKTLNTAA